MRGRTSPSFPPQKLHKERETIIACAFANVFRWKRLNSYDKSNINEKIECTFWALNSLLGKKGVRERRSPNSKKIAIAKINLILARDGNNNKKICQELLYRSPIAYILTYYKMRAEKNNNN